MHPTRKTLWALAFLLAVSVTSVGLPFRSAAWAVDIQMPGLMIGLVCGRIYDSMTSGQSPFNPVILSVALSIVVNASVYYLILKFLFPAPEPPTLDKQP